MRTAYHEAGHAVLSAALDDRPYVVSIRTRGHTLGRSSARMAAGPTSLVQMHLAGFAAEHVLAGRRPRQLDQEIGFALFARRDGALVGAVEAAGDRDGHRAVRLVLAVGADESDDEIRREVERLYEIARASLGAVWPVVEAVAGALLERGELDRDAFDDAVGDLDIVAPVARVQRAHGLAAGAPA